MRPNSLATDGSPAPIGHRAFVEVGADQRDAAVGQPAVHFRLGEEAVLGFPRGRTVDRRLIVLIMKLWCAGAIHRQFDPSAAVSQKRKGVFLDGA